MGVVPSFTLTFFFVKTSLIIKAQRHLHNSGNFPLSENTDIFNFFGKDTQASNKAHNGPLQAIQQYPQLDRYNYQKKEELDHYQQKNKKWIKRSKIIIVIEMIVNLTKKMIVKKLK